jgi:uracil phosphoribosyltransferase
MVHHIGQQSSILGQYMSEIRAVGVQDDRLRFRHNLSRIAEILAYEVSKQLPSTLAAIQTPLGVAQVPQPTEQPVLLTILRAGLAMHEGLLRTFDHADSAYISAYRKHSSPEDFEIEVEYMATPALDNKIWLLSDPMLATGSWWQYTKRFAHRLFLNRFIYSVQLLHQKHLLLCNEIYQPIPKYG